ncbi:hypothetical protein CWE17_07105 [Synechococcus sp. BS56D]|uniref:radical SAM protein n=1 Tax=Synechococcus sp. BS56D TaxID=2055944 RepID=UPI00103C386D|nr:radical SAM protein [Synechococcus sp. BS56D]TCD57604.1 hypothetical protein CWE17_07105 [Synechococcus sp. BS56D]
MHSISYAYLETTNYCNLDCVFCNRRDVVTKQNLKHMSLDEWQVVLDKLRPHPISEAKLMGLGEPFFHPHFDQITHMFKSNFPKAHVISATNLQYNPGAIFFNSLPNIDLLYLSIDGSFESYEAARPGSSWERLINSLKTIDTTISDLSQKPSTRFEINFVATPDTIDSFPDVLELKNKYRFIDGIRINIAQWWTEGEEISLSYDDDFINKLLPYREYIRGKKDWDFKDCFWPRNGIYMTVSGDLKVCCMNTSAQSIGNIFKQTLESIYQSNAFSELLNQISANSQSIKHCKGCSYKSLVPVLQQLEVCS